jgi:hypothetical protein
MREAARDRRGVSTFRGDENAGLSLFVFISSCVLLDVPNFIMVRAQSLAHKRTPAKKSQRLVVVLLVKRLRAADDVSNFETDEWAHVD